MLAHRLVAQGIGGRTVQELSDTMDVEEFLRWAAYAAVEPFGEQRQDVRNAMLMALTANLQRPKGKAAIPVEKFLPKFRQRRPMTMDELERALDAQYFALGGK